MEYLWADLYQHQAVRPGALMVAKRGVMSWRRLLPGRLPAPDHDPSGSESLSIPVDALRLIVMNYARIQESALKWTGYAGFALSLWVSLVVTNFSFKGSKYGLDGQQWQLLFVVAAVLATFKAMAGFVAYLRRPSVDGLMRQILARAEVSRASRALFVIKYRGVDGQYRLLVYRDLQSRFYILPNCNIADMSVADHNDPNLRAFVCGEIGVGEDDVSVERASVADLRSSKYSARRRHETTYQFSFYKILFSGGASLPSYLRAPSFTWNGRVFEWLALAEMEQDRVTRDHNIDVIRYINDKAPQLLRDPPDSLTIG